MESIKYKIETIEYKIETIEYKMETIEYRMTRCFIHYHIINPQVTLLHLNWIPIILINSFK